MGEIVTIIGGITVVFVAFDAMDATGKKTENKQLVIRTLIGLAVCGTGLLMKWMGV